MVWKPSRANRAGRSALKTVLAGGALRSGVRLVVVIGLLFLAAACGQNVQTNRPYTPAEGVNIDVGDPANSQQGRARSQSRRSSAGDRARAFSQAPS